MQGGIEEVIGNTNSEEKCADLVVEGRPSATGATWHEGSKRCWAEFGDHIVPSTIYRTCLFHTGNQ